MRKRSTRRGGGISTGRSDAATAASKGKRGRGFLVEFFQAKTVWVEINACCDMLYLCLCLLYRIDYLKLLH